MFLVNDIRYIYVYINIHYRYSRVIYGDKSDIVSRASFLSNAICNLLNTLSILYIVAKKIFLRRTLTKEYFNEKFLRH